MVLFSIRPLAGASPHPVYRSLMLARDGMLCYVPLRAWQVMWGENEKRTERERAHRPVWRGAGRRRHDGKVLSLKAECVAHAGCAAAGCASEEASSVCSRCEAVRYCSRECQRTDWKAHKPVCAAAQP